MKTFMLMHITDTDRFITIDTPEYLVDFGIAAGKPKFTFEGTIYEVSDVVYSYEPLTTATTAMRLLSLLTTLTGSEERAASLLERSE